MRKVLNETKGELVIRIYKYFDEINETLVVYHWEWNLDDIVAAETMVTEKFSKSVDN